MPESRAPGGARARRMLIAIAAVVAAPVLLSYGFYYLAPPGRFANYGDLLPTQPYPRVVGTRLDGTPFDLTVQRGRWVMLIAAPLPCDAGCRKALYATRQARTIQGKEADRIQRVWLARGSEAPAPAVVAEHADLLVVRVDAPVALPKGEEAIYLVDPIGNQVLAWPRDPDIKAMAKDVGRLLKASRIG